jgi:hypothetical protein
MKWVRPISPGFDEFSFPKGTLQMNTTNTPPASSPQGFLNGGPVFLNFLSDLNREQFSLALETACTWFRSRETMRQIQQEVAHQALVNHELATQKLRSTNGLADMLNIQTDLMRSYLEAPGQYWQQVTTTGLQTQIEMMARMNHLFTGKTGERLRGVLKIK